MQVKADHIPSSSELDEFLGRNRSFASSSARLGLTPIPTHQLVVVTCLDGRVDPAHVLGIELGDALVVRNAGGRVTDEVLVEVAFVAQVTDTMFGDAAEPFEVAVIHHTGCGSAFLADPDFRRSLVERAGLDDDALADLAVTDPTESVRADVDRLLGWAPLSERVRVSGHVYDLDTGRVTTISPAVART